MESSISQLKYKGQMETLSDLHCWLEQDISNYEIVNTETIFDEDNDEILMAFRFNRGSKEHTIVITSEGFVRYYDMPVDLFVDIHNSIVIFLSYFPVINTN